MGSLPITSPMVVNSAPGLASGSQVPQSTTPSGALPKETGSAPNGTPKGAEPSAPVALSAPTPNGTPTPTGPPLQNGQIVDPALQTKGEFGTGMMALLGSPATSLKQASSVPSGSLLGAQSEQGAEESSPQVSGLGSDAGQSRLGLPKRAAAQASAKTRKGSVVEEFGPNGRRLRSGPVSKTSPFLGVTQVSCCVCCLSYFDGF